MRRGLATGRGAGQASSNISQSYAPYEQDLIPLAFADLETTDERSQRQSPGVWENAPILVHSMPINVDPVLEVRFFATETGNEPVREWLSQLPKAARREIGTDIKTAQFGWPLGMPTVRKLEPGLWEIRTDLGDTIARVIFSITGATMVLLHGFIKKTQKLPSHDLKIAKQRKARIQVTE